MRFKILGWLAIGMGLFSLAPSVVPGAMSAIGLLISIFALILASISSKSGTCLYLQIVTAIYALGVLFFNDGSRLFFANPDATLQYKVVVYSILAVCVAVVFYKAKIKKDKI